MPEIAEIAESTSSTQIGAVGHFVSALMQSSGLDGQAAILEKMGDMIVTTGSLLYLISLIAALVSIGVFGNYKKAMYLAIAPALFFMFIKTTITVDPTTVRFGNREASAAVKGQETFYKMLYASSGESESSDTLANKKVSWFFVYYDRFVTSLVQGIVAVLLDTENKEDLIIAGRERLFDYLLTYENKNPQYVRLLSFGLMGKCGEASRYANEASWNDGDLRKQLVSTGDTRRENTTINLDHGVVDYLESFADNNLITEDEKTKGITCERLYEIVKEVSKLEAQTVINNHKARVAEMNGSDIPWDKVWEEAEKVTGQNIVDVIAAVLLRNTMQKSAHAKLVNQIYEQNFIESHQVSAVYSQYAAAEGAGMIGKLVYFAGLIPYIQGLILMTMTVLFPFFTLLLLIPSREMNFFIWMYIWLWVKSWDVGFAVVSFFKDFLWQFTSRDISHVSSTINWEDIDSIYEFVAVKDPIATPNTYSTIIAIITLSIPIITANLCLGAGNLKGFVSKAMRPIDAMGDRMSKAGQRETASEIEMTAETNSAATQIRGASESVTPASQSSPPTVQADGSGVPQTSSQNGRAGQTNSPISNASSSAAGTKAGGSSSSGTKSRELSRNYSQENQNNKNSSDERNGSGAETVDGSDKSPGDAASKTKDK